MENQLVSRFVKGLGLKRHVVGVNFLAYREEFEKYDAPAATIRRSICGFANMAMNGECVKFRAEDVGCSGGSYAVGLREEPERTKSGRIYEHCGLYSSHAVARNVNESMTHIPDRSYGIAMAPLEMMADADVVIILCTAKQAMRIIQGYTYIYGCAKQLSTVGNQAMCSDMCAKPFMNNDLNITFMCCGARINTKCDDGEMAIGMPIQKFKPVAEGVLSTLNVTEPVQFKRELLERLDTPDELGFDIDMTALYAKNAAAYQEECMRMEQEEVKSENS